MGFVFYDTETTGISTSFDQILQFAAIRTDEDLNELDRFEVRCRLRPHVLPHPSALCVTGMSFEQISDRSRPSHYEMVRAARAKLLDWSPSIFVGYNSFNFDEHLLRQALFQTLYPPYLTNTNGNCRADVLKMVQVASVLEVDCVVVPTDERGRSVFKLDQLAIANGFAHTKAHDVLADVEATIYMARCVMDRAPDVWNRFIRFASKAAVSAFVDEEQAFALTEFYSNRPYHYALCAFARDPGQSAIAFCLDLRYDPVWLATLSTADLAALVISSPRPVRRVRLNAAPAVVSLDEISLATLGAPSLREIKRRADTLRADPALCARLTEAMVSTRSEREPSEHFEEQIYDGFASPADLQLMARFHELPWAVRPTVIDQLQDARLRHFGRRLVFEHDATLLRAEHRAEIERLIETRMGGSGHAAVNWTTVHEAHGAVVEMIASGDPAALALLTGYRDHLAALLR